VVQSTAVQQKTFVPLNAATIIFINAITGIIIWEDGLVVESWIGYVCVFLLLALGCGLLLGDLGLLQETSPEIFRGARPSMIFKLERTKMLDNIKNLGHLHNSFDSAELDELESGEQSLENSTTGRHHHHHHDHQPHHPKPNLPTSTPSATPRRNHASILRQRSRRSKNAWASIYEAGKAAPRLSVSPGSMTSIRWNSLRRELEYDLSSRASSVNYQHSDVGYANSETMSPEIADPPPVSPTTATPSLESVQELQNEEASSSSYDVVEGG
jgi:hypothetical protein